MYDIRDFIFKDIMDQKFIALLNRHWKTVVIY